MDTWNGLWIGWLGLFLVLELIAFFTHHRTLSAQVWDWFSLWARKRYWLARRIIFGVFAGSLFIGHFYLHGPALWTVVLPAIPFVGVIYYSTRYEPRDTRAPKTLLGAAEEDSSMMKRLLTSLGYGLTTVMPLIFCATCKPPATFEQAWPLLGAFLVASYGAFKSSQTILAPNRPAWTEAERRKKLDEIVAGGRA